MKRIVFLVALSLSTTARADGSVSLRFNNSFISDAAFDALSDNDHLLQMELNGALEVAALWRGALWVEASYLIGGSTTELFDQAIKMQARLHTLAVGARFTYPLLYWLVPFVRADLGVTIGTLEVTPRGGVARSDLAAAFTGCLLAGVEVLWPRKKVRLGQAKFTGGLVIEAGYGLTSGLAFDRGPGEDDELQLMSGQGSSLGSVALGGPQLRVGFIIRF